MKKFSLALAVVFGVTFTSTAMFPVVVGGQETTDQSQISSKGIDSGRGPVYRNHAEYALDMMLREDQRGRVGFALNPEEYTVGAGDYFTVRFVSGDIADIGGRVDMDGELFIKSVGSIEVAGKSLPEAIAVIGNLVKRSYTEGGYNIQLTDFRFVQVNIVGEVGRPGTYYVPAIWRVSEAIELAGGLLPEAAIRRIELRQNGESIDVDLLKFRIYGDTRSNPLICRGQNVIVPSVRVGRDFISVTGLVENPGIFDLTPGDRVDDFIDFAGGAKGELADMNILLIGNDGDISATIDGADSDALKAAPEPNSGLKLVWKAGRESPGYVLILGEVTRPGRYPLNSEKFTLKDLLDLCGGITEDGCMDMIEIYRRTDFSSDARGKMNLSGQKLNSAKKTLVSYNPRRPQPPAGVNLAEGDSLYVPRATGMVSVTGAVVSPGLVPYHRGENVNYYLERAGGLGYDADRENMVIINPVTGAEIDAANAGQLFDGEIIFVPRKDKGTKS